jgi:hypothetical protein
VGLTVAISGKVVSGSSVTTDGIITIAGSSATIGTAVSIVLTPTFGANGHVVWVCGTGGDITQFRFVPSECRH